MQLSEAVCYRLVVSRVYPARGAIGGTAHESWEDVMILHSAGEAGKCRLSPSQRNRANALIVHHRAMRANEEGVRAGDGEVVGVDAAPGWCERLYHQIGAAGRNNPVADAEIDGLDPTLADYEPGMVVAGEEHTAFAASIHQRKLIGRLRLRSDERSHVSVVVSPVCSFHAST